MLVELQKPSVLSIVMLNYGHALYIPMSLWRFELLSRLFFFENLLFAGLVAYKKIKV